MFLIKMGYRRGTTAFGQFHHWTRLGKKIVDFAQNPLKIDQKSGMLTWGPTGWP